ncbi:MAG TPA: glycine cleavage system protein H [Verrucomicrobiae bacterium]|nr:glycine cleavage system protein H [Verrucomicrobiae bacterium]
MPPEKPVTLFYKRSRFVTHLPVDYRYSPSHAWAAKGTDGAWRVGLTKFATRMLGEMVDHGFEPAPGAPIQCGQIIGWLEGFKAISDIFSIIEGNFLVTNGVLKNNIALVSEEPYQAGWLYEARGQPDPKCIDVKAYAELLDKTIDRILEKQKGDEIE